MIKYLLIIIAIILVLLFSYFQFNSTPTIKKQLAIKRISHRANDSSFIIEKDRSKQAPIKKISIEKTSKINIDKNKSNVELNDFDREMAENEKEIIKSFLNTKEVLTKTYNLEEEDNVPEAVPFSEEEYDDISLDELNKIEKDNNIQPIVVDMPNIEDDIHNNRPITKDELEEAEKNAGVQETIENRGLPLNKEDISFVNEN